MKKFDPNFLYEIIDENMNHETTLNGDEDFLDESFDDYDDITWETDLSYPHNDYTHFYGY